MKLEEKKMVTEKQNILEAKRSTNLPNQYDHLPRPRAGYAAFFRNPEEDANCEKEMDTTQAVAMTTPIPNIP